MDESVRGSDPEKTRRDAIESVRRSKIAFTFTVAADGGVDFHALIPERATVDELSALFATIQKRTNEVVAHYNARAGRTVGLAKPPPGFDPRRTH